MLTLLSVSLELLPGVLVSSYCLGALGVDDLGFTSAATVSSLLLISEVALGFIAFFIGNEFHLCELKQTGRQAVIIGIVQALVALDDTVGLIVFAVSFGVARTTGQRHHRPDLHHCHTPG